MTISTLHHDKSEFKQRKASRKKNVCHLYERFEFVCSFFEKKLYHDKLYIFNVKKTKQNIFSLVWQQEQIRKKNLIKMLL